MKLKPVKLVPALITISVIALFCLLRLLDNEFFDRLERITFDKRVKTALHFPAPVATNLGAVFISDQTIELVKDTGTNSLLQFGYGLYWPRHIYGRALRELSAQGVQAVGFDIMFGDLRSDHPSVPEAGVKKSELTDFLMAIHPGKTPVTYEDNGEQIVLAESDDYFAWQLHRAGRAILAADRNVPPDPLFATNAMAFGDISADKDADGVLRRARAFQVYTNWHPAFRQLEEVVDGQSYGVDLKKAKFEPGWIVLPRKDLEDIRIPVDAENNFELADFGTPPPGVPPKAKAFNEEKVWHMGVVLAAQAMGLDLNHPDIDFKHGAIILSGTNGLRRLIPVDRDGYFYINWELQALDPRLFKRAFEELLFKDRQRQGGMPDSTDEWKGKLVMIGSSTTGNELTDMGATPLSKNTLFVSKHWNVANSILTGRFVHRASPATECLFIIVLGLLAAWLTWQLQPLRGSMSVLLAVLIYIGLCFWIYVQNRYWLPMVLPLGGAMLCTHLTLLTWRVIFEQSERRRVRSVFSKVVSPNVVRELLQAEKIGLSGARREITVLFADVRGFTELTDVAHERTEAHVKQHGLSHKEAEAAHNESASETLDTVNQYLARVADTVKQHTGTLDKYIGDCVMAFWGAPTANSKHALACVCAAIDAQRAINRLNEERTEQNRQIEIENTARVSSGLPPKPLRATLMLGTGINTGPVTVGLMGSEAHILNYTVFGREVNLASRLEHESGRGHIIISEATYQHLLRDDPVLAKTCIPWKPVMVKGIRAEVKIYEVPWNPSGEVPGCKE